MKVKICGIRCLNDIYIVNELKPDYIGFIFYKKSKRFINKEVALELKSMLDKSIKAVGVFVNEDIDVIKDIVNNRIIDVIQLHGDEEDEYIRKLKKLGLPIIKAYRDSVYADYTLADNIIPGSGKCISWDNLEFKKPLFLAGGLDIDNVLLAKSVNPYCLDISSGVEKNGYKDYELVKEFIRRARS